MKGKISHVREALTECDICDWQCQSSSRAAPQSSYHSLTHQSETNVQYSVTVYYILFGHFAQKHEVISRTEQHYALTQLIISLIDWADYSMSPVNQHVPICCCINCFATWRFCHSAPVYLSPPHTQTHRPFTLTQLQRRRGWRQKKRQEKLFFSPLMLWLFKTI